MYQNRKINWPHKALAPIKVKDVGSGLVRTRRHSGEEENRRQTLERGALVSFLLSISIRKIVNPGLMVVVIIVVVGAISRID